jgi:hypothetical protein
MSEQPDDGADATHGDDSSGSDGMEEYRRFLAEEAVRFAGHQFDEDGCHDEEECEICLLFQAKECVCRWCLWSYNLLLHQENTGFASTLF